MTLEKLLIFGFALAALFAITTVAVNMMGDRDGQHAKYLQETGNLEGAGF